jgi:hypothetical protein
MCLSYIFCSHKYHKIVNNFIFENVKKFIFGAKTIRIIVFFTQNVVISYQKYGFGIRDPRSRIRKKPNADPASRVKKGTGFRIRNTVRYIARAQILQ